MSRGGGVHYQGPILGSDKAGGGLFEDIPDAHYGQMLSPYNCWVENFDTVVADATAAGELGATFTASAGVAANTVVGGGSIGRLQLNAGTAANTGWASVQFNIPSSQATYVNNRYNLPVMTSGSAVLAAGREVMMFARVGFNANAAGVWDGGALIGWFVNDTSLLDLTTLLPTVAAGGGIGFHIGSGGVLSYISNDAAITAAGTTIQATFPALTTTAVFYDFGIRFKVTDFTNQKGNADFYFGTAYNMKKIASTYQDGTLPITNAAVYSPSFAIVNGATLQTDMFLESAMVALARPSTLGTPSL